jgi:hypothetical protein
MMSRSVQLTGGDGVADDDCCDGCDGDERVDGKDRKLHTLLSIYLDVRVAVTMGVDSTRLIGDISSVPIEKETNLNVLRAEFSKLAQTSSNLLLDHVPPEKNNSNSN